VGNKNRLSRKSILVVSILILIVCFIALPHLPSVSAVAGAYFLIFIFIGLIFPLLMGLLTSLNPTIRGTISSLANSVMYAVATLGSWIAGLLYAMFNGFFAVGIFTAICFAGLLFSFILSGVLTINAKTKKEHAS
jgi:predicted MFS family arabinose efflux permease